MSIYREQVAQALRAVDVTSPTSYSWFGRGSPRLSQGVSAALGRDGARRYLTGLVERELYRSFYTQGRPVPITSDDLERSLPDRKLVDRLSSANSGGGGWEPGWEIAETGPLRVTKDGLSVAVERSDCLPGRAGLSAGAKVSVRRPKELRASSPGFYIALGDAEPSSSRGGLEVRLYFHITPDGAVPLTAHCSRRLNEADIPFRLKLVDDGAGYARCDAAVLYLERGAFERARQMIRSIASACAPHLVDEIPAFSARLAPGLAVGEHRPTLGASFGAFRCRLLAESIVVAHEMRAGSLEARLDTAALCFAREGLDIDAPYRAPGSTVSYEL